MEGFETVVDYSDWTKRGWFNSVNPSIAGNSVAGLPSRTGTVGRGLMLKGPYAGNASLPLAVASTSDFGMYPLGKSINSLWQAGGFVLGVNATFNKVNKQEIAAWCPNQICYDGAQYYWAVCVNNAGAVQVCYSTDLMTWTPTVTQPAGLGLLSTIAVSGSGATATVVVGHYQSQQNSFPVFTTNMGLNWSNGTTLAGATILRIFPSGNPTTPWAYVAQVGTAVECGVFSGGLTGTANTLSTTTFSNYGQAGYPYAIGNGKLVNGVVCMLGTLTGNAVPSTLGSTGQYFWTCNNTLDMTVAANWKQSANTILGYFQDITFFNNRWYAVAGGGILSAPQTGTAQVPQGPTAAWAAVVNFGNNGYWLNSIDTNGSIMVAVGSDNVNVNYGAIWTSTDGVSWTKANRFPGGVGGIQAGGVGGFTNVFWDGRQFVLTGGPNQNLIAVSPDGLNWNPLYYPDYAESVVPTCASIFGLYSGTVNGSGLYVPWSVASGTFCAVGINASAQSNGTRTVTNYLVTAYSTPTATATASAAVSTAQLSHYYELIATAGATANSFTFQLAIDGVIVPNTSAAWSFAPSADTGTQMAYLNLPRNGNFVMLDDIYLTDFVADPLGNTGQLGIVNIIGGQPSSDAAVQFTQQGTAASHAAQLAGALSNSEGGAYTYTVGAKDTYNATIPIPANYKIQAVQVEAYFTRYGNSGANASVGILSGTHEVDSPAVSAMSATVPSYASLMQNVDPNTGAQWTIAGLQAAKLTINKLT
jgi:hypothetical protein